MNRFWSDLPGKLAIGRFLGQGSYGKVYQGTYNSRPVAVKKLHEILLDERINNEDEDVLFADFAHESEISRSVKDPHVVEFIGMCINPNQEGGVVLVMELMDQTLEKYLQDKRGKLPQNKQVDICRQITSGLKYLHSLDPQILHRDLKSSNILLDREGNTAKISDFGQARFRRANQYLSTTNPGTFLYMPPECLRDGDSKFSDKGDVFSIGVLMLEIGTQHPPSCFLGGIGRPEVERRANDLSKLPDNHPVKFLVIKCLKDDRQERPFAKEALSHLKTRLWMMNQQEKDYSDFVAICQNDLREKIHLYVQTAHDLFQHHNTMVPYFQAAADGLEKSFQRASLAKMVGMALVILGEAAAFVGSVTLYVFSAGDLYTTGLICLGFAIVLQLVGGYIATGALSGIIVINHRKRNFTNKGIRDSNTLRNLVIEKYVDYCELRNQVVEEYNCDEDETIQTSLRYVYKGTGPKFDLPEFLSATPKERITIRDWTKALEGVLLSLGVSIDVALYSCMIFWMALLIASSYSANFRLLGLVLCCLSLLFSVLFAILYLVLIGVAAYYVNKRDRGSHLSRKLRSTADALELEAEELKPLATFVVPPISTPGPVEGSVAGVL
jgi:serine/threonine protein kinase